MLLKTIQKISSILPKSQTPLYSFSKIDKKPDLYSLLEVKPFSTQAQISYNYHRLLKQYNPSDSSDPAGYTKLLNEAYVILSNEKLRAKYD